MARYVWVAVWWCVMMDLGVLCLYHQIQDLHFFRELIMDGRWEEAQLFIDVSPLLWSGPLAYLPLTFCIPTSQPLKDSSFDHGRVIFFLQRQKFLELVDQHVSKSMSSDHHHQPTAFSHPTPTLTVNESRGGEGGRSFSQGLGRENKSRRIPFIMLCANLTIA